MSLSNNFLNSLAEGLGLPENADLLNSRLKECVLSTWPGQLQEFYKQHPELFSTVSVYSYGDYLHDVPIPLGAKFDTIPEINEFVKFLPEHQQTKILTLARVLFALTEKWVDLQQEASEILKDAACMEDVILKLPYLTTYTQWDYHSKQATAADPLMDKLNELIAMNKGYLKG